MKPFSSKLSNNDLDHPNRRFSKDYRKMLSAQLVMMVVMLVFLVITCHWCQARKLIVRKMSLQSGRSDGDDYESIVMV